MISDPDRWYQLGVHWHCYVEISNGDPFEVVSTREDLRERPADHVLDTPEEVAEWIAEMTRTHAHPETVHLIGSAGSAGPKTGQIGDDGHLDHDRIANLDVLSRGESLYYDFRRETDRMRLWAEAVTECREVHTPDE